MAPVARELSSIRGVLEPLQTAVSVEGQVLELHDVLEQYASLPVILIGWSWGAWLSFIFTAQHPALVKKLVLIGSGPFEEKYAANIMQTRLSRLSKEDRWEVLSLLEILNDPAVADKNTHMARFGRLVAAADSYDPLPYEDEVLECRCDVHQLVWEQAAEMRSSGQLLKLGKKIHCSVIAIHGDYDPHPAEGVREPLSRVIKNFRFILLENCGHQPWMERAARARFYNILKNEIG
ncbi:MAG: alpha/beta hydrolase [Chloroflexi bacterium]|nr:alpha/beta hydrolase [Chloroflexota bacterium]